jgi:hypothetical protein
MKRMAVAMPLVALLSSCSGEPAMPAGGHELAAKPIDVPSLDGLLAFADPKSCRAGPLLQHLLHTLLRDTTKEPVIVGPIEVPAPYAAAFGKPVLVRDGERYTASVPVSGTWLGLRLNSIASRGWKGGDGNGFVITVRATRARLLEALRGAGFEPPAVGKRPQSSEAGDEDYMSITTSGALASLDCS